MPLRIHSTPHHNTDRHRSVPHFLMGSVYREVGAFSARVTMSDHNSESLSTMRTVKSALVEQSLYTETGLARSA
ncbi:hypothetical protein V1264_018080 [Littorina saxatilis]|uniref:Uncharacterized protein n=1 Tax=Littorina saxatilis TaxID=31220 RepID=A0AAN9BBY7_9CAEN